MTMTTSPADPTSPQRSTTQKSIDKCSSTWTASTVANSDIRYIESESYPASTILRTIPTGKIQNTAATVVVGLPADEDIRYPSLIECVNALTPTERQAWEDFFTEFDNSPINALAHSSAKRNLSSLADAPVRSTTNTEPQLTNGRSQSIPQLLQVLGEMEQLNDQLFQIITVQKSLAPGPPSPQNTDNNPPQPRLCPAPTLDRTQQYISPCTTPSAPHPAAIPLQKSTKPPATQSARFTSIQESVHPYPEPQPESVTQHVPLQEPPPAPDPTARTLQPPTQQHASQFEQHMCIDSILVHCVPPSPPTRPCGPQTNPPKTTIPTWAKPAVTTALNAGNPHWPPPRPNMKPTPYKKKSQTKYPVAQRSREKDSLRPP